MSTGPGFRKSERLDYIAIAEDVATYREQRWTFEAIAEATGYTPGFVKQHYVLNWLTPRDKARVRAGTLLVREAYAIGKDRKNREKQDR